MTSHHNRYHGYLISFTFLFFLITNNVTSANEMINSNDDETSLKIQSLEDSNHQCSSQKRVLEDLYERCTLNNRSNATLLNQCNLELSELKQVAVPTIREELNLLKSMNEQLQDKFEQKLVDLSQCNSSYLGLEHEKEVIEKQWQELNDRYEETAANYADVQRSYLALKTFNKNRVDELKQEVAQMEEEVKKWKDLHSKTSSNLRNEQKRAKVLDQELKHLQSIVQPYCNVTLIYDDASQVAHHFANVTITQSQRIISLTMDFVTKNTERTYSATHEFYIQKCVPFIEKMNKQVSPAVIQICQRLEQFYLETIGPHINICVENMHVLYNQYAKEFMDEHILPKVGEYIVPAYMDAKIHAAEIRSMIEPSFWKGVNQIEIIFKYCRLSSISAFQEVSKNSLLYLTELEKQQNIVPPQSLLSLINYIGNDADFIVDFISYALMTILFFTKGIKLILFPFKVLLGLLFSRKKKTKSVPKRIKTEARHPQKTIKFQRYPAKVKVEQ